MGQGSELRVEELRWILDVYRSGLAAHREAINAMNVYPVPDGDTGTNMGLTVQSVLVELDNSDQTMAATCKAISHGSLMGARGNSGVILSQILRGMASTFAEHDVIDGETLVVAMETSAVAAYEAVMKPVEGTILTVVRESANAARRTHDAGTDTVVTIIEASREAGHVALERTPQQLAVLAEAGVVDAGGAGYLLLLDAMLNVLDGRAMPEPPSVSTALPTVAGFERPDDHARDVSDLRYEVMYFLDAPDDSIKDFKDAWALIGDSIVVSGGDGLWNCHVHTNDIGAAIEAAIDVGKPRQIRVTDLAEEVEEERSARDAAARGLHREREHVRCAVVAVSPAGGIDRIFHSLGVQELVSGGQTMNPSTGDLVAAVERAPSSSVVILPNNKNIVPVALQVQAQTTKTVAVLPTTSVPEGFACLLGYDPKIAAEPNVEAMGMVAADVVVGEITQAVRKSSSEAGQISVGDWLGLDRSGIRVVQTSLVAAAVQLLDLLIEEQHEIVTIIEGIDADAKTTSDITDWVHEHRPGAETEVHVGGQPHYPYFFGVE